MIFQKKTGYVRDRSRMRDWGYWLTYIGLILGLLCGVAATGGAAGALGFAVLFGGLFGLGAMMWMLGTLEDWLIRIVEELRFGARGVHDRAEGVGGPRA